LRLSSQRGDYRSFTKVIKLGKKEKEEITRFKGSPNERGQGASNDTVAEKGRKELKGITLKERKPWPAHRKKGKKTGL